MSVDVALIAGECGETQQPFRSEVWRCWYRVGCVLLQLWVAILIAWIGMCEGHVFISRRSAHILWLDDWSPRHGIGDDKPKLAASLLLLGNRWGSGFHLPS